MLSKSKKTIIIYGGLFLYYLLMLYPVLRSGWMYDDILNYTSKGYALLHNMSIWQMTKTIALEWFHNQGRTFFFAWYSYAFFSIVGLHGYKLIIVLCTFVNGIILSLIISRYTKDGRIGSITVSLFPIVVSLNSSYFNAMFGFHMLVQVVFFWSLLSWYFFILYLEKGKYLWQILSGVSLFIALGTYEISYVLCLLFFITSIGVQKNFLKAIKKILPQIFIALFWLALTIYATKQAPASYPGTSIKLGEACWWGFLKQLSGSSCYISNITNLQKLTQNIELIEKYQVRWIISFLLAGIVLNCYIFLNNKKREECSKENYNIDNLILNAVWIIVGPCILIALSGRYQNEVDWGKGYLAAYVSTWGVCVCIAVFFEFLLNNVNNKKYLCVVSILICASMVIPNQMIADLTIDEWGNSNYYGDLVFREAKKLGLFDSWNENERILDGDDTWGGVDQHYDYAIGYRVNAHQYSELYEIENGVLNYTQLYDEYNDGNGFYYIVRPYGGKALFMAYADRVNVWQTDQGTTDFSVYSDEIQVYVPDDSTYTNIAVTYDDGQSEILNLDDENLENRSKKGALYDIQLRMNANIRAISIQ